MILVDTNILVDIVTSDPLWSARSKSALQNHAASGSVLFIDVVYAELAAGFANEEDCSDFVERLGLLHSAMSRHALWRAGRAFRVYRTRGGARTNVLPDFFIGAQAAALGIPLLTRDAGRYATYFPEVALITP